MNDWLDDLRTAVAFLTRLPMPHPAGPMPENFVRAHRIFPLVGAAIGGAVGLVCLGLRAIGVPDLAAAALALGAGAILTGALHEDGLADVADGFGGGRDVAAKLEIMRDSRLGTYGALILMVSFVDQGLRAGDDSGRLRRAKPDRGARAGARRVARDVDEPRLCAQGRIGRQCGQARSGDGGHRGRPCACRRRAGVAGAHRARLRAGGCMCAMGMAWLAQRQIGGQTGDVLGGAEQVAETAILVLLAARLA